MKCSWAFWIIGRIFSWIVGWMSVQFFAQVCQDSKDARLGHNPFFFFVPAPICNLFGAAYQAEILSAASGTKIAVIKQMKKIVPLITCADPFSQRVCKLVLCVNVTDLNLWVQINPVKQPVQSNSVGPWNIPHCKTTTFDKHFDYRLIVLIDIQHSTGTRMLSIWWNVINVCRNDVGVLDWDGVMHVWLDNCRRVSTGPCVLFCTEWNTWITKSHTVRARTPSMRKPASTEMISASVELCETDVGYLHIQLVDTNVWLPKNTQDTSWCWFWVSKSPAKSVMKQSKSALLCCLSHITELSVFTSMMNVRDHTRQLFVTCLFPFRYRTSKFVHRPQNIKSPNTCQTQTFQTTLWTNCRQVSDELIFFFKKIDGRQNMVWRLCIIVKSFYSQVHNIFLHISLRHLPCHWRPRKCCFCIRFPWNSGR